MSRSRAFGEFVQFIAIGGLAAFVNLASRFMLDFIMPFELAVLIAYALGMIAGFFLFRRAMFSHRAVTARLIRRFIWVNLFGAALAWAVSSVMARQILPAAGWTFHPFELAHLCGVAAPAISSYFLHRHYTFA